MCVSCVEWEHSVMWFFFVSLSGILATICSSFIADEASNVYMCMWCACVRACVCVHACVHVGACISRNDNYFFILWFCFYLWCLLYLYKLICFYWWSWHQPCIELALYEIMGSGIGDSWNHPQRPEMCSFESFSAVPTRCAHSVVVSHSHYHEELLCLSCNLTYV